MDDKQGQAIRTSWIKRFAGRTFDMLHWIYIVQASISCLYVGVIAVWVGVGEYSRGTSVVEFLTGKPFLMATSVFFFVAFSATVTVLLLYIRSVGQTQQSEGVTQIDDKKSVTIKQLFMEAAYLNAICDLTLFGLFHGLLRWIPDGINSLVVGELKAAQSAVLRNIQDQANLAQRTLAAVTGRPSPVSVKRVAPNESNPASSKVTTLIRDSASASQRGRVDSQVYVVEDNTAFIEVYLHGKPVFVCDDLVSKAAAGQYLNNRPRWQKDYTATIVASIPELTPKANFGGEKPLGFLCSDNLGGGFESNPESERCICEIAWRLSVMLYRYDQLEALINYKRMATTKNPPRGGGTDRRNQSRRGGRN